MPDQVKQLIPLGVMIAFVFVFVLVKMMIDRWRYAKQSEHKLQVMILHKAGQPDIKLFPIESDSGIECIKIKTKYDADPIIHILGSPGEFPWVYPLGKSAFVQAHLQGIIYEENDTEPLSNTTDLPMISARMFGSIMQAISLATGTAMQKSEQEDVSEGQRGKQKTGLKIVYIGLVIIGMVSIIGLVLVAKNLGITQDFMNLFKDFNAIK